MVNNELETKIVEWSKRFIKKLNDYELIEIIDEYYDFYFEMNIIINIYENNLIYVKKINYLYWIGNGEKNYEYSNWDFTPDFTLLLKKKKIDKKNKDKEYELILINRENKSIGLRSIGEIMSYNRICDPMYSFLVSDKGHSNEISYFMINETFRDKLIKFNNKSLIIFSFEEGSSKVKDNSIIPPNLKGLLND